MSKEAKKLIQAKLQLVNCLDPQFGWRQNLSVTDEASLGPVLQKITEPGGGVFKAVAFAKEKYPDTNEIMVAFYLGMIYGLKGLV